MRYAEPYLEKELPLYDVSQEELENQPPPLGVARPQQLDRSRFGHNASATDTGTTTSSACLLLCQRHYD